MTKISLKCVFVLCLVILACVSDAFKVLVIFPYPSKSHGILGEGYVKALIKGGHEVTYVATYPLKENLPRLRQIDLSSLFVQNPFDKFLNLTKILNNEIYISEILEYFELTTLTNNSTIRHEEVQKLMMDPNEKFDAVIAEWMFSELFSGFASVFGAPLIWSSSMDPHGLVLPLIDEFPNPAYTNDMMVPNAKQPFSFIERVAILFTYFLISVTQWAVSGLENKVYVEGFGPAATKRGRHLTPLEEAKYNASLMLGNSYVSSGSSLRVPTNYKAIGGYHIDLETKPLPKDLQKIMDDAPNGVIYFSMGSVVKSKEMPVDMKMGIVEILKSLKQTVIWKFEESFPGLPENIHIVNWAPQQSILAHPNCVLFITHAGLLSITETLHFGVPVIGIPAFGDQFMNIHFAEQKGFGKRVDLGKDTPAKLKAAIEEILGDSKYRDAIKEMSFVHHHRLADPSVELVHWVEHVIKTRGAPHLRSPALGVPLYKKMFLDLVALILTIVVSIVYAFKFMCRSKRKVDVNKKNK